MQAFLKNKFYFSLNFFENSCFTMLSQFLLYSKVNQVNIYPFVFWFPFHLGHHRALRRVLRVLCAIQSFLITIYFMIYNNVYMSISQVISLPASLLGISKISVLQISSSATVSEIPHISDIMWYSFSFWLISLYMTVSRSTYISENGIISFLFMAE